MGKPVNRIAMLEGYDYGMRPGRLPLGRLGQFGADYTVTTDQLNATMDQVVSALKNSLMALLAKIEILSLTEDQRNNARQGTTALQGVVARLDGPSRSDVLAGNESIENWLNAARTVAQGIKDQEALWNDDTLFKHAAATIEDAWNNLKKQLPTPTNWWLIGGAAAALLGVYAYLLSPKIKFKMSGYKRRRKRRS